MTHRGQVCVSGWVCTCTQTILCLGTFIHRRRRLKERFFSRQNWQLAGSDMDKSPQAWNVVWECLCVHAACQRNCPSPQAQTSKHWGFPVWCSSPQKQRGRWKMTLLCMYKSPQLKWGELGCRVVPTSSYPVQFVPHWPSSTKSVRPSWLCPPIYAVNHPRPLQTCRYMFYSSPMFSIPF